MRKFLLALTLAAAGFAATAAVVTAFDPWNQRHYPNTTTSMPMTVKVGTTGELVWAAIDEYGYPEWRAHVSRALDSGSSDSDSLGNMINKALEARGLSRLTIREVRPGETPDLRHYAVSASFMEAKCGAAWATACVYLSVALPVPAYHKAASFLLWGYNGAAPVIRHETFHTLARACDQYRGGCPRASDGVWEGSVVCTSNPDTLMDCAGAARTATAYDIETFITAYPATAVFLRPRACASTVDPTWGGVWDDCKKRWVGPDGWEWDPATGIRYAPDGIAEWGACDPTWQGCWNIPTERWVAKGSSLYNPTRNIWSSPPIP